MDLSLGGSHDVQPLVLDQEIRNISGGIFITAPSGTLLSSRQLIVANSGGGDIVVDGLVLTNLTLRDASVNAAAYLRKLVVSALSAQNLQLTRLAADRVEVNPGGALTITDVDAVTTDAYQSNRLLLQDIVLHRSAQLQIHRTTVRTPLSVDLFDHNCGRIGVGRYDGLRIDGLGAAEGDNIVNITGFLVVGIDSMPWPSMCWRMTLPVAETNAIVFTPRGTGIINGTVNIEFSNVSMGAVGKSVIAFQAKVAGVDFTLALPPDAGNATVLLAAINATNDGQALFTRNRMQQVDVFGPLVVSPGSTEEFSGVQMVRSSMGSIVQGPITVDLAGVRELMGPIVFVNATLGGDLSISNVHLTNGNRLIIDGVTAARILLTNIVVEGEGSTLVINNCNVTVQELLPADRIRLTRVTVRDRAHLSVSRNAVKAPYSRNYRFYIHCGSGSVRYERYTAIRLDESFALSDRATACISGNRVFAYGPEFNYTLRFEPACNDRYDAPGDAIRIGSPLDTIMEGNSTLSVTGNDIDLGPPFKSAAAVAIFGTLSDAHVVLSSNIPTTGYVRLDASVNSTIRSALVGPFRGIGHADGLVLLLPRVRRFLSPVYISNHTGVLRIDTLSVNWPPSADKIILPTYRLRSIILEDSLLATEIVLARLLLYSQIHIRNVTARTVTFDRVHLACDDTVSPRHCNASIEIVNSSFTETSALQQSRVVFSSVTTGLSGPDRDYRDAATFAEGSNVNVRPRHDRIVVPAVNLQDLIIRQPWSFRTHNAYCAITEYPRHAIVVEGSSTSFALKMRDVRIIPLAHTSRSGQCSFTMLAKQGVGLFIDAGVNLTAVHVRNFDADMGAECGLDAVRIAGTVKGSLILHTVKATADVFRIRIPASASDLAVVGCQVNSTATIVIAPPPSGRAVVAGGDPRRYSACNTDVATGAALPSLDPSMEMLPCTGGTAPAPGSDAAMAMTECDSSTSSSTFACAAVPERPAVPEASAAEAATVARAVSDLTSVCRPPELPPRTPTLSSSLSESLPTLTPSPSQPRTRTATVGVSTQTSNTAATSAAPPGTTSVVGVSSTTAAPWTTPPTASPPPATPPGQATSTRSQTASKALRADPEAAALGDELQEQAMKNKRVALQAAVAGAAAVTALAAGFGPVRVSSVSSSVRLGDAAALAACALPDDPVDVSWMEYPLQFPIHADGKTSGDPDLAVDGFASLLGAVLCCAIICVPPTIAKAMVYRRYRSVPADHPTMWSGGRPPFVTLCVVGSTVFASFFAPSVVRGVVVLVGYSSGILTTTLAATMGGAALFVVAYNALTVDSEVARLRGEVAAATTTGKLSSADRAAALLNVPLLDSDKGREGKAPGSTEVPVDQEITSHGRAGEPHPAFVRSFDAIYDGNRHDPPHLAPRRVLHFFAIELAASCVTAALAAVRAESCVVPAALATVAALAYLAYAVVVRPLASRIETIGAMLVGTLQFLMALVALLAVAGIMNLDDATTILATLGIGGAVLLIGQAVLVAAVDIACAAPAEAASSDAAGMPVARAVPSAAGGPTAVSSNLGNSTSSAASSAQQQQRTGERDSQDAERQPSGVTKNPLAPSTAKSH